MRKCGECDACCTILGVEALNKPKGQRCEHNKSKGTRRCAIHQTKPSECSGWQCLWIQGLGASKDRPDRSGMVFWSQSDTTLGNAIIGAEAWFDAGSQTRAVTAIAAARVLAQKTYAHLMHRSFDPGERK